MRSVVELEVDAPQAKIAELFADPASFPRWMDDLDRCEPISGKPGMPGSEFRLVPKRGKMVFVAKVISAAPPHRSQLALEHRASP